MTRAMAELFISYARKNRDRVGGIADGLAEDGYSLWWDKQLKSGEDYGLLIEREIAEARGVVVCWSAQAKDSLWVRAEATEALDTDKLVQLKLDEARPPLPFNIVELVDFAGWGGTRAEPSWRELDGRVGRLTGRHEGAVLTDEPPSELVNQRFQGLGPVAAIGVALILVTALVAGATIMLGEGMLDPGLYRIATLTGFAAALVGAAFVVWRFARTAIATRATK
jgi:hypothetical protein